MEMTCSPMTLGVLSALAAFSTAACSGDCEDRAVYVDADGDGYGDDARVGYGCSNRITEVDPGFSLLGGDCDDADHTISPGADEVCNGRDDNCSDSIDEGLTQTLYFDSDDDGYGNESTAAEVCLQRGPGWVEQAGDCDDSAPEAHPDHPELCGDGIDNNCDEAQLPCTEGLAAVSVVVEGVEEQGYLGTALALGDFDGDGQEDLLTGARRAGGGSGAAYILYGPISGGEVNVAAAEVAVLTGSDSERAGFGVGAADLDGDGLPEAIIGAVDYDSGSPSDAGGVYIFPSGTRHTDATLTDALLVEGDGWQGRLGRGISDVGDLSGDGQIDLFIGASEYLHPTTSEEVGACFLLLGGPLSSGSIGELGIRILADDADSEFAHQGALGADFNGDGFPDLLTSAYNAHAPGGTTDSGTGRVYLVTGPITEDIDLVADPTFGLAGASSTAKLGYGMAAADTDGDGYPEAWLGSHGDSQGASLGGVVWQVPGSITLSDWDNRTAQDAAISAIVGTEMEGSFGSAVALSDLNGDTHIDLVVGSMFKGDSQGGAASVFYGPLGAELMDTAADMTLPRLTGDAQAGEHLLVGANLLGTDGPVLVIGGDGESDFSDPEGAVEHRDQAGAVFLVDLLGW